MIDYFDFSQNQGKVFIPKAKHTKKKCVFDKYYESQIKEAPSLDAYAKYEKEKYEKE